MLLFFQVLQGLFHLTAARVYKTGNVKIQEFNPTTNDRCGAANNGMTCTPAFGDCCSAEGLCGTTANHCDVNLGCQTKYGKCDSTSSETLPKLSPRPHIGSVPYAVNIFSCTKAKTIALTFDDGPNIYTNCLLDILAKYKVTATFFITGDNKKNNASIDKTPEWMAVLRRIVSEGHQIGTHTWRHLDQNAIGDEARRFEWVRNEMALHKILGFIPTYARAPYGNCNTECVALAQELGYHLINWSLSTNDFLYTDIASSQKSKDIVRDAYQTPKNYISLSHDTIYNTVYNLVDYQIKLGIEKGYSHVTVGECLEDSKENWHRPSL